MPGDDFLLIKHAQANPKEYGVIYTKYVAKVFDYFWYRCGYDQTVAEDLTQETFLRGFQHLPSFRNGEYAYSAYLLKIAHNLLVDYYRKAKALPFTEDEDTVYSVHHDAEKEGLLEELWNLIETLPENKRVLMVMRYRQEWSFKEMAEIVGISENAIKLQLSRLRKQLLLKRQQREKGEQ